METLLLAATLLTTAPAQASVEPAPLVEFEEIPIDFEMTYWGGSGEYHPLDSHICRARKKTEATSLVVLREDWTKEILRSLER